MSESSAQERTEEATPKRKLDSRKKGQVPRSKELETVISLLAAGLGMMIFGKQIVSDINEILLSGLLFDREAAFNESLIGAQLRAVSGKFVLLLAPLFVLLSSTVILSSLSLGGWIFSPANMAPKMERISPIKGLGRIFSSKSAMELLKAVGKFGLVATTTVFIISNVLDDLYLLPLRPVAEIFGTAGMLFVWSFLGFSSVLILVAVMDVPFQIWSHNKQIRMTKQEIRDESKETDGRPEVKAFIRERQQEIATQRMMQEVPKADVVITNPTHYAVALRYDPSGQGAPKVVAKGRDLIAARIREVANEHNVEIFSAPPLARALYASTKLNQQIPNDLFLAVAHVLAYIFQLRRAVEERSTKPKPPKALPIPKEYGSKILNGDNN